MSEAHAPSTAVTAAWRRAVRITARAGRTVMVGATLSLMFPLTLSAQQDTTPTLLRRASVRYREFASLRGTFVQTLTNPGVSGARTAKGELFQHGALHFALRYSDPAGDAIVSDDSAVWVYLPSTMKGQVLKLSRAVGGNFDFISQLLSLPTAEFETKALPDDKIDGRTTGVYELVPKKNGGMFQKARLWIGRADTLLWQVETVEPSGMLRTVRFTRIRLNGVLPADALRFTPPAGTRIIDQAAMMGGGKRP